MISLILPQTLVSKVNIVHGSNVIEDGNIKIDLYTINDILHFISSTSNLSCIKEDIFDNNMQLKKNVFFVVDGEIYSKVQFQNTLTKDALVEILFQLAGG